MEDQDNRISRCHWCKVGHDKKCPHGYIGTGRAIIENGGCLDYVFLDPALRTAFPESMYGDGKGLRRIRKKTTICMDPRNVEFVNRSSIPGKNGKPTRFFTRKVHTLVEVCLKQLDGKVPRIPPDDRKQVEPAWVTFMPDVMKQLDSIVDHWKGTNEACTRSQVIDYFVSIHRKNVEKIRSGQNA